MTELITRLFIFYTGLVFGVLISCAVIFIKAKFEKKVDEIKRDCF